MSRPHFACALFCSLTLALAGCDGESTDVDSGPGGGVDSGMTGGTDSGMTGGTDSGMTGGTDSGPGGTDSGPEPTDAGPPPATDAGPPPPCDMGRIRIQEDCGTFAACGGAQTGMWCYSDVCITPDELIAQVIDTPGIPSSCDESQQMLIEVTDAMGTIDGTVVITSTTIQRNVTNMTQGTFWLPETCAIAGNCAVTQAAIDSFEGATASCASMARGGVDGCECDISFTSGITGGAEGYTLDGNTIVITADGQRLDYCVDGEGNLAFRDESADPQEPGTQTLRPDGA